MRDWVMKKFQDDEGLLNIDEASGFIQTYIPKRSEWKAIQNRIVTQNERSRSGAKEVSNGMESPRS